MNYNLKLNLKKLKKCFAYPFKTKDGKMIECVCFPIKENNVFVGEKGLYLDLVAVELENKTFNSFMIKPYIKKDIYQAMSEEEKKEIQIIGSMNEQMAQATETARIPDEFLPKQIADKRRAEEQTQDQENDLPF